ncbi:hypothetical protein BH10PSE19_BH10PSE19_04790 [soil metagenome]
MSTNRPSNRKLISMRLLLFFVFWVMAYGSRCDSFSGDRQETGAPPGQENADADVARSWLKTNAIRLNTVEAGHGFTDMQPLKKIIGDARIVARRSHARLARILSTQASHAGIPYD